MIQRKQTLYLLLSLVVTVACLCMPVAKLEPQGMGLSTLIYNLGTVVPGVGVGFGNWPLFALLVVTVPLEAFPFSHTADDPCRLNFAHGASCSVWRGMFTTRSPFMRRRGMSMPSTFSLRHACLWLPSSHCSWRAGVSSTMRNW